MAIGNKISFKELAKRTAIDPVANLLTGLQQGITQNQQQEPTGAIQQLGRFAGGLTREGVTRGADVTGKLAEFATRPETLEVASRIGQLATAYEDPQISNVLGQIAGDIGAKRTLKEQRELESKKQISTLEDDYRKEINQNPVIKDTRQVNSAVSRMNKVWDTYKNNPNAKSKNALDQALIITFNKMMDPGSVVRESEFARTPQGLSLINRLLGFSEKIEKGGVGLTDEARQEIINISQQLQAGQIAEANKILSTYEDLANRRNLNRENIFNYFEIPSLKQENNSFNKKVNNQKVNNQKNNTVTNQKNNAVTDQEVSDVFKKDG